MTVTAIDAPERVAHQTARQALSELTAYKLAGFCSDASQPDSQTSAGGSYLDGLLEAYLDLFGRFEHRPIDDGERDADGLDVAFEIHMMADDAVPVYTHDLWATFVDLGAWQLEEHGPHENMNKGATVAMYTIASDVLNRLVALYLEEYEEAAQS